MDSPHNSVFRSIRPANGHRAPGRPTDGTAWQAARLLDDKALDDAVDARCIVGSPSPNGPTDTPPLRPGGRRDPRVALAPGHLAAPAPRRLGLDHGRVPPRLPADRPGGLGASPRRRARFTGGFIDHYLAGVVYPERYGGLVRLLAAVAVGVLWIGASIRWHGRGAVAGADAGRLAVGSATTRPRPA
jgi:hypothetical protein